MVLNIVDLPVGKAQKIVDAHNVAVNSHDALTARIAEQEKRIAELLEAVTASKAAFDILFRTCLSNGVFNRWGAEVDCTDINKATQLVGCIIKDDACALAEGVAR